MTDQKIENFLSLKSYVQLASNTLYTPPPLNKPTNRCAFLSKNKKRFKISRNKKKEAENTMKKVEDDKVSDEIYNDEGDLVGYKVRDTKKRRRKKHKFSS